MTDDVVRIARDLVRIDTTNTGNTATSAGERVAAEYVAGLLSDAGLDPVLHESEPGRASVVARWPGEQPAGAPSRGALLLHGHLDVVPAEPTEWKYPPFSGEIADGYLWGRGAVDMKNMDAMILEVVRRWTAQGRRPPRDVVLAFLADEEAGSALGGHWLVQHHPELFEGVTEAVGEVGGFSVTLAEDRRLYLIETAEKGIAWMRLTARGRAGHGSMVHAENAVTTLAEAVSRIGRHRFPIVLTETVRTFLTEAAAQLGIDADVDDPDMPAQVISKLGPIARMVDATVRNTANPTILSAGYKANVIPGSATGVVDGRILPGQREHYQQVITELAGPDVTVEWLVDQPALETTFDGDLVEAMNAALRAEDPGAYPVPYMLSGGTDAKAFDRLGIRCFGFSPLMLPPELDFAALFHGVDERIPVESLRFGVRVLERFLANA